MEIKEEGEIEMKEEEKGGIDGIEEKRRRLRVGGRDGD